MVENKMTTLQILCQTHPLGNFLNERTCTKDATVTGMGGDFSGRWHIPDKEYGQFLDLLNDYLFVQKNRALGFVEQPRANAPKPLLIDLDFHYKKNQAIERRFTEENIREFCDRIAKAYSHFFDMSNHETLRFFVTLRPEPYDSKDKIKDGIHILCPDAPLSNEKWNVLRKYLLSNNIISDIFGHTEYQNKDEDVFDPSMGRKQGWMFYGASKPTISAYKLTNVFAYTPDVQYWEDEDINKYTSRQLLELMSVRYKVSDDVNIIRDDRKDEFDHFLNPPAPRYEAPSDAILNQAINTTAINDPLLNALVAMLPQGESDSNLLRAIVMECLSADRAADHDLWMKVGWCLHNISKTEEMFQLWMDFTQEKCPSKWSSHRAREVPQFRRDWHTNMRMDGDGPRLSRRSLYKWARDDNLQKYNELINANVCEYILTQTDTTHYHVACLMKKMWESLYVASVNSRTTDWFYYDEILNMWRRLNQGMELRQKICIDVANKIQDAASIAGNRFSRAQGNEKEQYARQMKDLHDMQVKLYNSGFNDSVMKMCGILFFEEDFVSKMNVNATLFGCANGVIELRHKNPNKTREHVLFRQGKPEDYLSFLAGKNLPDYPAIPYTPYEEFVKAKDPRLAEIHDFFAKLFPREDLKKHVLKLLAACLEGSNREQLFYFFIGVGSNGKSKLVKLMELTFGDYQTPLQSTVFTRKRPESGAANPDLIVIKGRRFIYSQEPDDKEPLNTSRMKQMSGEDMIEARAMYGDQERFKVMGRIFMMCNRLPPINSMDNGTWRRIRVVPFESRFEEADHPDLMAGKPNFYPRDNNLDEKLFTWREPFLSYLVHLYEHDYIPNGLQPEPPIIKQESERYKADHDAFAKFRSERIRESLTKYPELTTEKVSVKEILKAYNRWIVASGAKKMDLREMEHRCDEAFGDSRGTGIYKYIRVFLDEEDIEEFDRDHETA